MIGGNAFILYNLKFFAKDGPGGEKTEPATSKKLSDARKEGQVAKSTEIVTAISLISFFVILKIFVGSIGTQFLEVFQKTYNKIGTFAQSATDEINVNTVKALTKDAVFDMVIISLPIFAAGFLVSVIGDLYQVKWKPTGKPLKPKFSKLNPIKGFKKIFSTQSVMNLLKSIGIIAIIIYIVWNDIADNAEVIFGAYDYSLREAI